MFAQKQCAAGKRSRSDEVKACSLRWWGTSIQRGARSRRRSEDGISNTPFPELLPPHASSRTVDPDIVPYAVCDPVVLLDTSKPAVWNMRHSLADLDRQARLPVRWRGQFCNAQMEGRTGCRWKARRGRGEQQARRVHEIGACAELVWLFAAPNEPWLRSLDAAPA